MRGERHSAIPPVIAGLTVSIPGQADHPLPAFGAGGSGPITTLATAPLARGQRGVGIRAEYTGFDRFSDTEPENVAAAGRDGVLSVDSLPGTASSVAYGARDNLTPGAHLARIEHRDIREVGLESGVPARTAGTCSRASGFRSTRTRTACRPPCSTGSSAASAS